MIRWFTFLLIATLLINCLTLSLLLKKDSNYEKFYEAMTAAKSNTIVAQSIQQEEIEQKFFHLSQQLQNLRIQINDIQTKVNQVTHTKNISSSSKQHDKTSKPTKNEFERQEQANNKGLDAIDNILLEGSLSQKGSIELHYMMSKMSPEKHQQALQKLIIAINNGHLTLLPGAVL